MKQILQIRSILFMLGICLLFSQIRIVLPCWYEWQYEIFYGQELSAKSS